MQRCSLTVRSYECDALGHVNNAVYLNYLEFARHEYLRALGVDLEGLRAQGFALVVTRVCIDYRAESRTHDVLEIATRPVRRGRTSGVFRQEVTRGGQPVAEAEVTWACLDARGRPSRLPPELDLPELAP